MTHPDSKFHLPEYFYGDLGPAWTEGKKGRPCMCRAKAQLARYRLAWVMREAPAWGRKGRSVSRATVEL